MTANVSRTREPSETYEMKVLVVLSVAGLLLGALYLWFVNPMNWGTTTSEHFTIAKFESIKPGDRVETVIASLGQPLGIGDWPQCAAPPYKNYVFAGDPVAPWVFGYRKAWVIVGNDGRVVYTNWYLEP